MCEDATHTTMSGYDDWLARLPTGAFTDVTQTVVDILAPERLSPTNQPLSGRNKAIGDRVYEMKVSGKGPGYRVYYTNLRGRIVLICGGNKTSQDRDIKHAKRIARDLHAGRRDIPRDSDGPRRGGGPRRG